MDSIEKKVYDLMDWGGIEGLAYSDLDAPQDVLGVHETEDGSVICAICPGAREAKLLLNGKKIDMYLEDLPISKDARYPLLPDLSSMCLIADL